MPRRAFRSLACWLALGVGPALGLGSQGSQEAPPGGSSPAFMDRLFKPPARILGLQELAAWLRREGVPLSFLERPEPSAIALDPGGEAKTLRSLLEREVREAGYDYEVIGDRLVVFPAGDLYRTTVSNVRISGTPRLEATDRYLETLARDVPELGEWIPPIMKGDPEAPIYGERVSLSARASVLEHLVELLGRDESLMFSLIRWRDGRRYLLFERGTWAQPEAKNTRGGAGR